MCCRKSHCRRNNRQRGPTLFQMLAQHIAEKREQKRLLQTAGYDANTDSRRSVGMQENGWVDEKGGDMRQVDRMEGEREAVPPPSYRQAMAV